MREHIKIHIRKRIESHLIFWSRLKKVVSKRHDSFQDDREDIDERMLMRQS